MDEFTEKIGMLLTCEPKFCIKENCLLYNNCCDAERFISMLDSYFIDKYKDIKTYSFSKEDK